MTVRVSAGALNPEKERAWRSHAVPCQVCQVPHPLTISSVCQPWPIGQQDLLTADVRCLGSNGRCD